MKTPIKITIAMIVLLIGCIGPACIPKRALHRNHTVEFRLAESKMSDGLTEQTLANSDEKIYLHKEAIITADDIDEAEATHGRLGDYLVNVRFTGDGARKMEKATSENILKRLAIIIDGKVLSAPTIQSTISSSCQITGNFTKESAESVAKSINGE